MSERKLIPVDDPSDPNRCQSVGDRGEGQCSFTAVDDTKHCPKHGAGRILVNQEKKRVHDYRLNVWQTRLDEFTESDQVKNLRGEIGVLRIMIENLMNMCQGDETLLQIYSGKIGDLIVKLEKCVTSCDRLEGKMGMLLDKASALILAQRVVEVIGIHVKDAQVIDNISAGIIDILASLGSKTDV